MKLHFNKIFCAAALAVSFLNTALATPTTYTLYNSPGQFNGSGLLMQYDGQPVGTAISISGEAWLNQITLQYNAPSSFGGDNIGLQVSIYENTGAGGTPAASAIWQNTYYNIPDNGNYTLTIDSTDLSNPLFGSGTTTSVLGTYVTGTFTIAAAFYNVSTPNQLYGIVIPLANNPSGYPGVTQGDYWTFGLDHATWVSQQGPLGPQQANMLLDVQATPEPSSLALAAIGGVLILGANKLRRKHA
jgi:hypothetical protein